MKQGIHPEYRTVVFRDASNGQAFLSRSTLTSDKTIQWEDGKEYPLINLEISSTSHPFYTGTQRLLDTAGRVERFEQRYGLKKGKQPDAAPATGEADAAPAPEAAAPAEAEASEAPEAEAQSEEAGSEEPESVDAEAAGTDEEE